MGEQVSWCKDCWFGKRVREEPQDEHRFQSDSQQFLSLPVMTLDPDRQSCGTPAQLQRPWFWSMSLEPHPRLAKDWDLG